MNFRLLNPLAGVLLSLAWLLPASAAHAATQTISVAPIGNLYYQIDCLAGYRSCSRAAFHALWQELGWDAEADDAALARFAAIRDRYAVKTPLNNPAAKEDPVDDAGFGPEIVDLGPSPLTSLDLETRLRLAGYGSASLTELHERLVLLLHPQDTAALAEILEHFEPRFMRWWRAGAEADLLRFRDALAALLVGPLNAFVENLTVFFGLAAATGNSVPVALHLIAHPQSDAGTRARQLENHSIIEVLRHEAPEQRLGVVVHELAHYFFRTAPRRFHDHRMRGALDAGQSAAPAALALMNEALAAAIGNGALEHKLRGTGFDDYLARPRSFYDDAQIDTAAKLILPLVQAYLAAPRELDEAFVTEYYGRILDRLRPSLDTLEARLRVSAMFAADAESEAIGAELPSALGLSSVYDEGPSGGGTATNSVLARHGYLNGVVLARMESMNLLAGLIDLPVGLEAAGIKGGIACTLRRPSGAILYLLLVDATAPAATTDVVNRLRNARPCDWAD